MVVPAIEIECDEIRMMLPQSMTAQFRSGFLRLLAEAPLTVVATYSSRPREQNGVYHRICASDLPFVRGVSLSLMGV